MRFLTALRFLTIIRGPLSPGAAAEPGKSLVFFPVVGLLIGLSLALLRWLLGMVLPPVLVNALLVLWLVIVSGGLHLDGAADTFDGVGGQKTPEARLAVMRDSRIGGFGAIAIVLALLLKFAALSAVTAPLLLIAPLVISRWAMVYAVTAHPYARPQGLGKLFKEQASRGGLILATVIALVITAGFTRWGHSAYAYLGALVIFGGTWLVVALISRYFAGKLGGLTGDTYGAVNEIGEISAFAITAMLLYNGWLGVTL